MRLPHRLGIYLSPETYARLRKRAAARGVPQSTLVEEALQSVLA